MLLFIEFPIANNCLLVSADKLLNIKDMPKNPTIEKASSLMSIEVSYLIDDSGGTFPSSISAVGINAF